MDTIAVLKERYKLIKEISPRRRQYTSRRTFIAEDIQTKESLIVKIIQPEERSYSIPESWTITKLFEREAHTLKSLSHPAIPRYEDAFEAIFEEKTSLVLVQTYIEAKSLEQLIQSGKRFSISEAKAIAEKLLQVLIYLHEQSPAIIHRDIKPSNILVSGLSKANAEICDSKDLKDLSVHLIDFGAVHTDISKENGTITTVGSYGYIPLEQFSGHTVPASDLYGLGMTLIYLITGVHPMDLTYVEGRVQIPVRTIEPAFLQWLERMTAPYLDQRFDSAQQALITLRSRHTAQGYYRHLAPKGTNVIVERSHSRLSVIATRRVGISFGCITSVVTALLFCFSVWLMFSSLLNGMSLLIATAIFSHYGKKLGKSAAHQPGWLPTNEYQFIVEIDHAHGLRTGTRDDAQSPTSWHAKTRRYEDINLVTYTPGYELNFNKLRDGDEELVPYEGERMPELCIHAGDKHHPIGKSSFTFTEFSPAELWWLSHEISDFLGLELQITYPMPSAFVRNVSNGCGC